VALIRTWRSNRDIAKLVSTRDTDGLVSLGVDLRERGDTKNAQQAFNEAANLGSARALTYLAWLSLDSGDEDTARRVFKQACALGDFEGAHSVAQWYWDHPWYPSGRYDERFPRDLNRVSIPLEAAASEGDGWAALKLHDAYMVNAKVFGKGSENRRRERRVAREWLCVAVSAQRRDDELLDTITSILIKHPDRYGKEWENLLRAAAEGGSARACREYAKYGAPSGSKMIWYSKADAIDQRKLVE
jgi:hypothetical protein